MRSVECQYRLGASSDALCVGVLATQVFLDTYATEGIRPELAREVLASYSPQAFAGRLAASSAVFVLAEAAGGLVAFAEMHGDSPCPAGVVATRVELVRLYVQPSFQRHRIGTSLLSKAEEHARAAGAQALWLSAWAGIAERSRSIDLRGVPTSVRWITSSRAALMRTVYLSGSCRRTRRSVRWS